MQWPDTGTWPHSSMADPGELPLSPACHALSTCKSSVSSRSPARLRATATSAQGDRPVHDAGRPGLIGVVAAGVTLSGVRSSELLLQQYLSRIPTVSEHACTPGGVRGFAAAWRWMGCCVRRDGAMMHTIMRWCRPWKSTSSTPSKNCSAGRVAWCVFVKGTLASPCLAQAVLGRSIPECEAGPVEQAP